MICCIKIGMRDTSWRLAGGWEEVSSCRFRNFFSFSVVLLFRNSIVFLCLCCRASSTEFSFLNVRELMADLAMGGTDCCDFRKTRGCHDLAMARARRTRRKTLTHRFLFFLYPSGFRRASEGAASERLVMSDTTCTVMCKYFFDARGLQRPLVFSFSCKQGT